MDQKPGLDKLNRGDAYSLDDILAEYTRGEPPAPEQSETPAADADRTQVFESVTDPAERADDPDRPRRFERPTAGARLCGRVPPQ